MPKENEETNDKRLDENLHKKFTYVGILLVVCIIAFMGYSYMTKGTLPPSNKDCECARQFYWECDILVMNSSSVISENRIHLLDCAPVNPCNLSAKNIAELRSGGCVYGNGTIEVNIRPPKNENVTENTVKEPSL